MSTDQYESGMGSGRGTDAQAAQEQGMGASEGYRTGAAESGMGRSEGYTTGAQDQEQGMGVSEGYQTGAYESGMGASEGGPPVDSTDDYGLGSGRASDQKEGKVGKFFDKVKERLTKPHEENK